MMISIIDDNELVRESFALILETEKHEVKCFESAEDLLSAKGYLVDCLLLDNRLGGMTGCELVRHLRNESIEVPALIVSGNISSDISKCLASMRQTSVLQKPCMAKDVLEAINELGVFAVK